jgi:hypothetical protein
MQERLPDEASGAVARPRLRPIIIHRLSTSPARLWALILLAALWGMVVDGNFIPILAPTGNSTVFQASTAASFALLGILFGPLAGALGGLIRDGSSAVVTLALHPAIVTHPDFLAWSIKKAADIFEDVVLGWVPGLIGLRTRRPVPLTITAVGTAWLSLPFLVICNTLADGHPAMVWTALRTMTGDWDQPVDPGLTVYALLTGGMVALFLAPRTTQPVRACLIGGFFTAAGLALIAMGGHN